MSLHLPAHSRAIREIIKKLELNNITPMETTEKKLKGSVKKRMKLEAVKEAAKTGPATAYLNDVPTSPRKMRLVADIIRGERVSKALNILKYEAQHASVRMEKLLLSAISNWELKNKDVKLERG